VELLREPIRYGSEVLTGEREHDEKM
jgi:hypothetical protein